MGRGRLGEGEGWEREKGGRGRRVGEGEGWEREKGGSGRGGVTGPSDTGTGTAYMVPVRYCLYCLYRADGARGCMRRDS